MSRTVFALGVLGLSFTLAPIVMGPGVAQADPTLCEASQDGTVTCTSDPPRPDPRLHGMRAFTADGFEQVVPGRIWDSVRLEECFWRTIDEPDGEHTRCLPAYEWLKAGWYLDPACTQRVHWQEQCSGNPRYVRDEATSHPWKTCSVQPLDALYPLGNPLPIGTLLYTDASGSCQPQPNAFGPAHAIRPLGLGVSPSAFVEATIAPE